MTEPLTTEPRMTEPRMTEPRMTEPRMTELRHPGGGMSPVSRRGHAGGVAS